MTPNKERRQHNRFTVPGKTVAITPHNLGQVLDISLGGCAIKYIGHAVELGCEDNIDILMKMEKNHEYYLEKLPITTIWEDSPDFSEYSSIIFKSVGVQFRTLTESQQQLLHTFITTFGIIEN